MHAARRHAAVPVEQKRHHGEVLREDGVGLLVAGGALVGVEQLRGGQQTGEDGQTVTGEDGSITGENDVSEPTQGDNMSGDNQTGSDTIDWLDLTGHDEVSVKPSTVYDKYYIYYTTGGVNLRSGPGTSYDKITTVSLGTEVQAAAKQDGWTFVSVGGQFGWINSDYLVTTRPAS